MRNLNERFTDTEFERLRDVKGDRTWREAIMAEFGIDYE